MVEAPHLLYPTNHTLQLQHYKRLFISQLASQKANSMHQVCPS